MPGVFGSDRVAERAFDTADPIIRTHPDGFGGFDHALEIAARAASLVSASTRISRLGKGVAERRFRSARIMCSSCSRVMMSLSYLI